MTRNRPIPPSLVDPPDWVTELAGFEMFRVQPADHGWSAWPEGVDENVEFPGGDLAGDARHARGPLDHRRCSRSALLFTLADGAAKVEDKIQELVTHCRTAGKTWTQIGQTLGMTKQSAWERFSGED